LQAKDGQGGWLTAGNRKGNDVDPRLRNLADILVNYSLKVKEGDWAVVWADVATLPLVIEIQRKILQAGGHLDAAFRVDDLIEDVLILGNENQIRWMPPGLALALEEADAVMTIRGPSNTRSLAGADPARQAIRAEALGKISKRILERARAGKLRWVTTNYPCQSLAQEANMSLREYEDFIYGATYADQPDPVSLWEQVHEEQDRLVGWLEGKERLEVHGPDIDLTLSIQGRKFLNAAGKNNMPDGEIYTSPVEESAEGWVRFTYPAIHDGREVEGVELHFDKGRVVKATARKNEAYLNKLLDLDAGARHLGEFAIGNNATIQQFTGSTLYDEKIGGTIHMAVGLGFEEAGGRNKSALHWDMVCDMRRDSEILVDGMLFYKDGQFQV
jgi:aminopeptidase